METLFVWFINGTGCILDDETDGSWLRKSWGAYRDDYGKYENWLQRNLQNWKEIKVLNARENQVETFNVHWERLKKIFIKDVCIFL